MTEQHVGTRYDRLPATDTGSERPSREAVLTYFDDRFGMEQSVFSPYTLWERGRGKIWAFRGEQESPVAVEAMGIHILRTRHRFWKPTTDAMQLFGGHATKNIVDISRSEASAFWQGDDVAIEWERDPSYVVVFHEYGRTRVPLGVGFAKENLLESLIPKGRQRSYDGKI